MLKVEQHLRTKGHADQVDDAQRDPGPPPQSKPSRVITTNEKETNDAEYVECGPRLNRSEVRPHGDHQSLGGQQSQRRALGGR